MRKPLLLLLVVASLAAAGAAAQKARPAASPAATVKITHTGYQPTSASITVGDDVAFTNTDTVAHTVIFKTTTGMNCSSATPLVLQPSKSASCTFSSAGTFAFSDPANSGKNFHGTVDVAKAPALSLTAAPTTVIYGRKTTLTGTLASGQAGQTLKVMAHQCTASAAKPLATITTTSGGAYSYQAQPLKQTAYTIKFKNSTSAASSVNAHPRMRIGKVGRHTYVVHVYAAQSFAGKYATFQRYRPAVGRWVKVKLVRLRANATGVAPTVITSAKFHSHVRARTHVRIVLGQGQVGACYLAGRSNAIRG